MSNNQKPLTHKRMVRGHLSRSVGWYSPELREQAEPVEHQVERDVLAIAEAEHLDVADRDGAAGPRHLAGRAAQNARVRPAERSLLDGNVAGDVQGVDVHVRVRKGAEPAAEEFGACLLALS